MAEDMDKLLDTVKSIAKGAVSVYRTATGIRFSRFTKKQEKAYTAKESLRIRSACPSGVCLDFYTDSGSVRIGYRVLNFARNWLYFDLFVDGVFSKSAGSEPLQNEGEVNFSLDVCDKGAHRVTLYLPHLCELEITGFALDSQAEIKGVPAYDSSILFMGDSITQGMDARYPSFAYPVQVCMALNANLLNHGVGGYVFDADAIDEDLHYAPDRIFVAYGTNDWQKYGTKEEFFDKVVPFFEKLTTVYDKNKLCVLTPIWRYDIHEQKSMGSFFELTDSIKAVCREYGVLRVIDGLKLTAHDTRFFGGQKNPHPNDLGFTHYAKNLLNMIENGF